LLLSFRLRFRIKKTKSHVKQNHVIGRSTAKSQAFPQQPDRQASLSQAQVGHGVQGHPSLC